MKRVFTYFLFAAVAAFTSCKNEPAKNKEPEVKSTDSITATSPAPAPAADSIPSDGLYEKRHENGQIAVKGEMRNGKREGVWFSYYQNGAPWSQSEYSAGARHGKNIAWYPSGQKRYEGYYTNDKQTGAWKYWNEDGSLAKEVNYDTLNAK